MTPQEGAYIALKHIAGDVKPHRDYQRAVEVAKEARAFATGEGIDGYMRQFTRRESFEMFEQRKAITQHLGKEVVGNVASVFYKAPRAVQKEAGYTSANTTFQKSLDTIREEFWGDKTLEDYTAIRFIELNTTDPNAWVVLEWKGYNGNYERAKPYPFEVAAKDAILWRTDFGKMSFFLCHYGGDETTRERFTIYLPNQSVSIEAADRSTFSPKIPTDPAAIEDGQTYEIYGGFWRVIFHEPHNLGYVPAWRIGVNRDMTTDGRTFVSLFDAALPRLHKMLKTNSEKDLTAALIAFPLSLSYAQQCEETGCMDGQMGDGKVCGTCKGTGVKNRPTTVQEEIVLPIPRHKEEMVSLPSLVSFVSPPIEVLTWMENYVDKLTEKAKQAVFNSEIFTKAAVSETATEKTIDLDNVYDVLYKFAVQHARLWEWLVYGIADVAGIGKDLIARAAVSQDFRLKSLDDLFSEYEKINQTGASTPLRLAAENEIARTMFSGQPERLNEYAVLMRLNPLSGMSANDAAMALLSGYLPERTAIIHYNFKPIIERCEAIAAGLLLDFYTTEKPKQDAIFEQAVTEISATLSPRPAPEV